MVRQIHCKASVKPIKTAATTEGRAILLSGVPFDTDIFLSDEMYLNWNGDWGQQVTFLQQLLLYKDKQFLSGLQGHDQILLHTRNLLCCTTPVLRLQINQGSNEFLSTQFNLTLYKWCINQKGN